MREQPVGIVSFGAYIPRYRLSREVLSREWQEPLPRQRVCVECGAKDDFTDAKLGRRGVVHTFTNDYLLKKAHFQSGVDIETVLGAPLISSPLGLYDCCPTTDGCVTILANS